MKNFLKDYFFFNKGERTGFFVLLSIIIFLMVLLNFVHLFKQEQKTDFSAFEKEIEVFINQKENQQLKLPVADTISSVATNYFLFDPNTLDEEGWIKLGLSKNLIRTILNYRNKGGKFYKKEDLKSIYGFPDDLYKELATYIVIKKQKEKKIIVNKKVAKEKKNRISGSIRKELKVLINAADTSEFKKLKGIGSSYANRIVKYRNLLGGFYSINQLKEVYGMDKNRFQLFEKNIVVDSIGIEKLNINNASLENLKSHPYINWKTARAIVDYRKRNNNFKKLNELKNIIAINDSIFNKISPYLKVEK